MNNFKHIQNKIWEKELKLKSNCNAIIFWLCCFTSITYKPISSNIKIEYIGYLVLQHNRVLMNVKYILNCLR